MGHKNMKFINQMEPSFDECERIALNEYMMSDGWVTEFKKTREFEASIAEYTGASFCSVVSNGTVALSVALMACGVSAGDEVIVPDYTMVATPNAVELIGAKAVFADIDIRNLCMDFESMKRAVTERTKAIILVSINGRYPENVEQFVKFCKRKNIYLVEDAAQSLGSFYHGKHVGRYGDIGSFSFSAPKIITTGQGGALITDNEELFANIKRIRDFGRDRGGEDHYVTKGWNFKFTDIQAVIGLEQMKKLSDRVQRKKWIGKMYEDELSDISKIELIHTDFIQTVPWFFDILCDDREDLMIFLKKKNIGTRAFYPALHREPAYNYEHLSFPMAEEAARRGLWLPSAVTLIEEEVKYICNCIKEYYGK